jgi:hypothetical protein
VGWVKSKSSFFYSPKSITSPVREAHTTKYRGCIAQKKQSIEVVALTGQ